MSTPTAKRTTAEKLKIFQSCFSGLKHVYGTYDPVTGCAWQAKAPVTREVFLRHLQGQQPYGVYLLNEDRTLAAAADFDDQDPWLPMEFLRQAKQYGIDGYLERSKSKGWHVWVFFPLPGVVAVKARLVVGAILADIDASGTEVFPKQDRLTGDGHFGNFINAPLFGKLVFQGRTVFVDPDAGLRPYSNQWDEPHRTLTQLPGWRPSQTGPKMVRRTDTSFLRDFGVRIVERNRQNSSRNSGRGIREGATRSPLASWPSISFLIRSASRATVVLSDR